MGANATNGAGVATVFGSGSALLSARGKFSVTLMVLAQKSKASRDRVLSGAGRAESLAPITGSSSSVEPRGRDGHLGEFRSSAVLTAVSSGRFIGGAFG
jgi:hypothetical protein